jgi:hypothetical protein
MIAADEKCNVTVQDVHVPTLGHGGAMKIVLILFATALLAQTPPVLDLAANPARFATSHPTSGSGGGWPFHGPHPDPKLPLSIELESIRRISENFYESLVLMLVKNIGTEPYLLPIGRDGDSALASGNHGRHEFWFNLKVAGERYSYLQGQVTYASTDLPETFLMIAPDGVVRVRFKVNLKWAVQSLSNGRSRDGQTKLSVQGACVDTLYDDNPRQYFLHLPAPDAFSANELRVPIVWEESPKGAPKN